MKFRAGDRVVVTKRTDSGDAEIGTVHKVKHATGYPDGATWYKTVEWDSNYSEDQLEFEAIWNSSLQKALRE